MLKHSRTIVSVVAAGALLVVPAASFAGKGDNEGKNPAKTHPTNCSKQHKAGFVVSGTLVSAIADDPATPLVSEASVTLTVTGANMHARKSGELADQDATTDGVQVKGGTYTVAAGDAYKIKLNGYEGLDTPSVGDRVHVIGKIALTKKRCAAPGTSTADRYGAVNVRKVMIGDRDADATPDA